MLASINVSPIRRPTLMTRGGPTLRVSRERRTARAVRQKRAIALAWSRRRSIGSRMLSADVSLRFDNVRRPPGELDLIDQLGQDIEFAADQCPVLPVELWNRTRGTSAQ